jgi:hypothetical protein
MDVAVPVHLEDAVTLKKGQDSAHRQMLDVCRKALPGWEQLTVADIQASKRAAPSGCETITPIVMVGNISTQFNGHAA